MPVKSSTLSIIGLPTFAGKKSVPPASTTRECLLKAESASSRLSGLKYGNISNYVKK